MCQLLCIILVGHRILVVQVLIGFSRKLNISGEFPTYFEHNSSSVLLRSLNKSRPIGSFQIYYRLKVQNGLFLTSKRSFGNKSFLPNSNRFKFRARKVLKVAQAIE